MSYVDPTREQFKAIFGLPLDRPVHMINLLRFRDLARYRDSDPEAGEKPVSGAEAYRRYGTEAAPHFAKVGGKQLWIGAPELMLIGPPDERWNLAFVAYYPSAHAFVDMLRNPDYRARRATAPRLSSTAGSFAAPDWRRESDSLRASARLPLTHSCLYVILPSAPFCQR